MIGIPFEILIDNVPMYYFDSNTISNNSSLEILNIPIDCNSITGNKKLQLRVKGYASGPGLAITNSFVYFDRSLDMSYLDKHPYILWRLGV